MQFDNSNLHQKIRIRNNVYKFDVNFDNIVEFFSGEGNITQFWSKICKNVISIDQDESKLEKINIINVEKIHGNNLNYLHLSESIEIIDCDSYGECIDFIEKILKISKTDKKLIFFTDGFCKVQKKKKRLNYNFDDSINSLNPSESFYEKATGGNVYYGYLYFKGLLK